MTVGDVQDQRPDHDLGHGRGQRGQHGPALEHVVGAVHAAVEVVVGPQPREPALGRGPRRVAQLGPAGAERVDQEVDAERGHGTS